MRCLDEESLPLEASPVHCFLAYGLRYELSAVLPSCLLSAATFSCHDGLFALWNHKPDKPPSISRLDHSVLGQPQKSDWYTSFWFQTFPK